MALRKLLLILSLFIMGDCFGQPMTKLIRKKASSCSYLLDQYSGAAAAYSLRLLDCDYSGSAIRVRRSSDNTEQDIGFVNGNLDTATLKTFVGTGGTDDGFVVTWYDQSGNGRNMTQSSGSAQPYIMDNGVVYRENSLPAISFIQSNLTALNVTFTQAQPFTVFSAAKIPTASTSSTWYHITDGLAIGGGNSSPTIMYNSYGIAQKTLMYAGTILGIATSRSGYALTSAIFDGSSSEFFYNNSSILSGNAGTLGFQDLRIGRNWDNIIFNNIKYFELIIYGADKTSDVSGINSNINTYYSIY